MCVKLRVDDLIIFLKSLKKTIFIVKSKKGFREKARCENEMQCPLGQHASNTGGNLILVPNTRRLQSSCSLEKEEALGLSNWLGLTSIARPLNWPPHKMKIFILTFPNLFYPFLMLKMEQFKARVQQKSRWMEKVWDWHGQSSSKTDDNKLLQGRLGFIKGSFNLKGECLGSHQAIWLV